jgi:uroporphyrinogen-III synthase
MYCTDTTTSYEIAESAACLVSIPVARAFYSQAKDFFWPAFPLASFGKFTTENPQQRAFTSLKLPKIPSALAVESGRTALHGLTSGAPAI